MYDWANSAFATTILAAVLPVYYSQVAGATLPSATVATSYWAFGLSISLVIVALLSPILGTISDVTRAKKRFLAAFTALGVLGTALLVLVETGDWILASILGIIGRIGFNGAISFYDSLLPHVAQPEDQDRVSTRGYAMGYLGGGLLLAINVVMIQMLPGTWGARLSFLSVAIWWAIFSIPLFKFIPEPLAAEAPFHSLGNLISLSFKRLWHTLTNVRRYKDLFKFLIAFLIYNDGIGTIIGMAAIYGAELGLGNVELILALLLVQFVGIPYSLIFGRLSGQEDRRRPFYLAFVVFNLIALPLIGISGAYTLPANISGAPPAPYQTTATSLGQGVYRSGDPGLIFTGGWVDQTVSAGEAGSESALLFTRSTTPGARIDFPYNGQKVKITYSQGPDHGIWGVQIDHQTLLNPTSGQPVTIDTYRETRRYDAEQIMQADTPGEHILTLISLPEKNPSSQDHTLGLAAIAVLPAARQSNLGMIIGLILLVELVGLALSYWIGPLLFSSLAQKMDTRRSILLALLIYSVIATLGFFINSVIEFWFLAWLVAIVQGGSQALSRSLYSAMTPARLSGEFFGLFGIMEKFSAILGPLFFAAAGTLFGSSRPAVLSVMVFFILGGLLLSRVNVEEGKRVARLVDQAQFQGNE
jgi:UMF1 family MFS transporter